MRRVVAGGIVRNRAWILGESICALRNQSVPPDHIAYLTGDNKDATEDVLKMFGVEYWVENTGYPGFERGKNEWNPMRYSIRNLAMLRNDWCKAFEGYTTHLLTVDSDIILNPDVLERLLALDCPLAGAFIPGCIPMDQWDEEANFPRRSPECSKRADPFNATSLFGCYLIRKDFLDKVNWNPFVNDPQGEDVGLARLALEHSIKMMADPLATGKHIMHRP